MTGDPIAGSIGDPQSLNRYAYVLNNPLNLIDPLGLELVEIDGCQYEAIDYYVDDIYQGTDYYPYPCNEDTFGLSGERYSGGSNGETSGGGGGGGIAGGGFTLGIRAPNQTFTECMAANANTYSLGGSLELGSNVAFGTNTSISSKWYVQAFTGNSVNSLLFGDVGDAAQLAGGSTPMLVDAGMGKVTTHGRRTTDLLSLNLEGRGGVPKALSSVPTKGAKAALGRLGRIAGLGLSATVRWGIDIGLTGAEAIGCVIPRSP